MLCTLSHLKPQALHRIQDLEKQLGQTLVAINVHPVELSPLEPETLKLIKKVEKELGVVLLAINNQA